MVHIAVDPNMKRAFAAVLLVGAIGCESPEVSSALPEKKPTIAVTHDFAIPVLMYHRVRDLTEKEQKNRLQRDLTVSISDFEEQVKFLKENGFTFLTVSEVERALHSGDPLPVRGIALTFDDGYGDNFSAAFPILQKFGAKATLFMVTSNFGRPDRVTWENARTMVANNFSFESHSVTHPDLTTLSTAHLRSELEDSKRILEEGLGVEVRSLAYPAGAYNDNVVAMMPGTGYFAGWKKGGGVVTPQNAADPYRLPRVRVHGRTEMKEFKRSALAGLFVLADRNQQSRIALNSPDLQGEIRTRRSGT